MDFVFVSGHVALDFAGTVQHRRTDAIELLTTPEDLSRWTAAAGLVDSPVPADQAGLAKAVDLRESIYRLAFAAQGESAYEASDRERLNLMARPAPVDLRLADDGSARRVGDLDAVLATVSRAAIELLSSPVAHTIKECTGDECTRLYVDHSRRGSRRWCDMRWCGNRAKAALYRARHA